MSIYLYKCVVPGCDKCFEVEAISKKEAVNKLLVVDDEHDFEFHPELPIIFEEKKKSLLSRGAKLLEVCFVCLTQFVS